MLTSNGVRCDVCGGYILLDKSINPFRIPGFSQQLHCHDRCKTMIQNACGDWKKLPFGPIRHAFEEHYKTLTQ